MSVAKYLTNNRDSSVASLSQNDNIKSQNPQKNPQNSTSPQKYNF
ncbi:hypothetical protein [Helicobacter sp. 23-1045]